MGRIVALLARAEKKIVELVKGKVVREITKKICATVSTGSAEGGEIRQHGKRAGINKHYGFP